MHSFSWNIFSFLSQNQWACLLSTELALKNIFKYPFPLVSIMHLKWKYFKYFTLENLRWRWLNNLISSHNRHYLWRDYFRGLSRRVSFHRKLKMTVIHLFPVVALEWSYYLWLDISNLYWRWVRLHSLPIEWISWANNCLAILHLNVVLLFCLFSESIEF